MTALHQFCINSPKSHKYETFVSLVKLEVNYCVITLTIRDGVHREHMMYYENYVSALKAYVREVSDYAEHTAYMNL